MVTLYAWPTPNAHKGSIMLEECAIDYKVVTVDITAGDQFNSDFLAISPINRMPALVDDQGPEGKAISIFESGAIVEYILAKYDRHKLSAPPDTPKAKSFLPISIKTFFLKFE